MVRTFLAFIFTLIESLTEKSENRRKGERRLNSKGVWMLVVLLIIATLGFSANAYQGFLVAAEWKGTIEKHINSNDAHSLNQTRNDIIRVERSVDRVERKIDALLIDRGIPREVRDSGK